MKLYNMHTIVIVAAIIVIAGCSANKTEKSYCNEKGKLSAYLYNSKNSTCKVDFRYRNLSKHPQKPVLYIIAYDDSEKIIFQDRIYFPEVNSGASQNLTKTLPCEDKKIARIFVNDATDANRCYGYNCSALCDVKGTSIELSK